MLRRVLLFVLLFSALVSRADSQIDIGQQLGKMCLVEGVGVIGGMLVAACGQRGLNLAGKMPDAPNGPIANCARHVFNAACLCLSFPYNTAAQCLAIHEAESLERGDEYDDSIEQNPDHCTDVRNNARGLKLCENMAQEGKGGDLRGTCIMCYNHQDQIGIDPIITKACGACLDQIQAEVTKMSQADTGVKALSTAEESLQCEPAPAEPGLF